LLEIVEALIVGNQRKTLSGLARLLQRSVDPKALADFFRESPWTVALSDKPRQKFMLAKVLELAQAAGIALKILVSLDKKGKATRHLDAVDYHHNHMESSRRHPSWSNGYVYVELHVQVGPFGFLFDTRLYLREKKIRQLNRERSKDKRLSYCSKYTLVREMLL
jgi:hypothetical protein